MNNFLSTQIRSTKMTSEFSKVFEEEVFDPARPESWEQIKELLERIETIASRQLRAMVDEAKKTAHSYQPIEQDLFREYPEKWRSPEDYGREDFDLGLTPRLYRQIDQPALKAAARDLRLWITAILKALEAVEHVDENVSYREVRSDRQVQNKRRVAVVIERYPFTDIPST
jgi:hypothetical protein